MGVLLHSLGVCEYKTSKNLKSRYRGSNQRSLFPRILPSRVNWLGYARYVKNNPFTSYIPGRRASYRYAWEINEVNSRFNFKLGKCIRVFG
jgi:hypothetical protein